MLAFDGKAEAAQFCFDKSAVRDVNNKESHSLQYNSFQMRKLIEPE